MHIKETPKPFIFKKYFKYFFLIFGKFVEFSEFEFSILNNSSTKITNGKVKAVETRPIKSYDLKNMLILIINLESFMKTFCYLLVGKLKKA